MSGIAFDTLRLAERLEAAGMPPQQARGVAAALADTMSASLVTREYLDLRLGETEARLRSEIADLRAEVRGWLVTQAFAIVGAVAAIVGLAAALARVLH